MALDGSHETLNNKIYLSIKDTDMDRHKNKIYCTEDNTDMYIIETIDWWPGPVCRVVFVRHVWIDWCNQGVSGFLGVSSNPTYIVKSWERKNFSLYFFLTKLACACHWFYLNVYIIVYNCDIKRIDDRQSPGQFIFSSIQSSRRQWIFIHLYIQYIISPLGFPNSSETPFINNNASTRNVKFSFNLLVYWDSLINVFHFSSILN